MGRLGRGGVNANRYLVLSLSLIVARLLLGHRRDAVLPPGLR